MIVLVISMVASAIVVLHGVFYKVNMMTPLTPIGMRVAWLMVTVGAFGMFLSPIFNRTVPTAWEAVLMCGVAAYVMFDRRKRCAYSKAKE